MNTKIFKLSQALATVTTFVIIGVLAWILPVQARPDCNGGNRDAPICNGGEDDPKPPKPKPTTTITYPDYYVVTLIYAPPGNGSEVKYGQGSSIGSRQEITQTTKNGSVVQLTSTAVDVEAKFTLGAKSGHATEVKKENSTTLSLQANPDFDFPSHGKDKFYIWVNPEVVITDNQQSTPTQEVRPIDGQNMQIVDVTAEELQNPLLLPAYKAAQLKNLTLLDRQQILKLDVFLANAYLDPTRFQRVGQLQMNGPDNPGDPIPGSGVEESYDSSTDQIFGHIINFEGTVLIGGEVNFIFKGGAKGGRSYEYEYEDTREDVQGKQQQSEVTLRTTTRCYHALVDVYFDAAFSSYAFVPHDASASCGEQGQIAGKVLSITSRKPVFNVPVTINLPDGSQRVVFTNVQGIYRVFGIPSTQIQNVKVHIPPQFSESKNPSTAQELLEALQVVNIDYSLSKSQILDWLGNPYSQYPQFTKGTLKLLGSQRLKNKVYLDVIFYNYKELGGKVVYNSLDGSLDLEILKKAIVEGYKTRNGISVSSFEDIVEY